MSDTRDIAPDRDATEAVLAQRWVEHVNRLDAQAKRKAGETQAPAHLAFVRAALHDLRRSQVHLAPALGDRWFPTAFNDWYCPLVRRGYVGGMATVFDVGVVLLEPTAEVRAEEGHGVLLRWIQENSFLTELAGRAISERASGAAAAAAVGLITWIMVEPLLRCLSGVWNSAAPGRAGLGELPTIERRPDQLWIYADARAAEPLYKLELSVANFARSAAASTRDAPASTSPYADQDHYPRVTGWVRPRFAALAVRFFAAHIASRLPELVHKLDHELVEACLLAPLLRPREHEPPRRLPSDVATTRLSKQPGPIAGVTRVETRRPGDPLIDILPSELMMLRRSRPAGLANILYGRPLVLVHEREWDIIPKHRALVCFIVDAHQDISSGRRALPGARSRGCAYRDGYVYAKRQVCDMLHDLADAQALVRRSAGVEIDAALFAISPGRDHAVVHQRIPLDRLKRAGGSRLDRVVDLLCMADLAPTYFIRYMEQRDRMPGRGTPRSISDALPSDVALFLRKAARQGGYRVIHLVIVGLDNASRLLERLHQYLRHQTATPVRITLVGVDLDALDADARLIPLREPAWTYVEAGSMREALELNAASPDPMPLSQLRARLVESVFGKEIEPGEAQLVRIRSG
jgi:hypothetical protein